jgi:hypothetical protein
MATVWAFVDPSLYKFNQTGKATKEWNRSTAVWLWVVNYTGPRSQEDEFVAALQSSANPPEDIKIDEDGEIVSIQAKYPAQTSETNNEGGGAPDPIFTAWTMTANVGNAPLIEDPRFTPFWGNDGIARGFTRDVIASILLQLQHWKSKKRQLADAKNEGDPTMPALSLVEFSSEVAEYLAVVFNNFDADIRQAMIVAGQELFENLATDNDQIEIIQPVLRKVQVLSTASQVQVAWGNVNRFYTWAALQNEEPTIDAAVVIGVATLSAVSNANSWYWQKRPPIVDVQADGKRQLSLEWWAVKGFDRWRYGNPIT